MITIIHGDDTTASRTFFINAKKKAHQPVSFEGDSLTLTDLYQVLSTGGLFGDENTIFIESFLTKKKKGAELTAIINTLNEATDTSIFLWEGKEIDRKLVTSLTGATQQLFTLPKSLFLFLDSIRPGSTTSLSLFRKTIEHVEPEMAFFMLTRQLRLLIAVTARDADPIDEVKRMAPWQKGKLEKQSRYFKRPELLNHYRKLYEIDKAQKTGKLPTDMISSIDFWLLEL